jgi:hypothetical protein
MKSRLTLALALLVAFCLGLASFHPIAVAMEQLAANTCSTNNACIVAHNTAAGPGIAALSKSGVGVLGTTGAGSKIAPLFSAGVAGLDKADSENSAGVFGSSIGGNAMIGISKGGLGVGGATNTGDYAIEGINTAPTDGSVAIYASAPNGALIMGGEGSTGSFYIDGAGNLSLSGQVTTSGSCSVGCVKHRRLQSYGTTAATPTIEDSGESQLTGGSAYVRIDPAFGNAIDFSQRYFVLITPEGDAHNLFVEHRGPGGFTVRESAGGRSSIPFAYRIVAHPYGAHGARLPFVQMPVHKDRFYGRILNTVP